MVFFKFTGLFCFKEVSDFFIRLTTLPLFFSPTDWSLIASFDFSAETLFLSASSKSMVPEKSFEISELVASLFWFNLVIETFEFALALFVVFFKEIVFLEAFLEDLIKLSNIFLSSLLISSSAFLWVNPAACI